jgi:RHS repeat-associated protein
LPNSDILKAIDSVNGTWSYSYDQMNRLCNASHSGTLPQCGVSASYNYSYDRFGNQWSGIGNLSVSFNALNNRIDQLSSHYDAAGNLLSDGYTAYTYDAESRAVSETNPAGTVTYTYDADGQRIRKTYASGTIDYVYDLGGHTTTVFNAGGGFNRGEIYAGGRHLGTYANNTISFAFADWLGTERASSTSTGAPYDTCTSNPFGDGILCAGGIDYSAMHFTGKEHDWESGLDNFGARYDSTQYGRFMTPDWSDDPQAVPFADVGDPQTLNRYTYARDNPVADGDNDGHACVFQGDGNWKDDRSGGQTCAQANDPQQQKQASVVVRPSMDEMKFMMLQSVGDTLSSPRQWADLAKNGLENTTQVGLVAGAMEQCALASCSKVDVGMALLPLAPEIEEIRLLGTSRESLLSAAQNSKLRNIISDLFRTGVKVGSGSTADAIRSELATGLDVGGRSHILKGVEYRTALQRLYRDPTLSSGDRAIVKEVLTDLQNALSRH